MENREIVDLLGRAFAYGEIDTVADHIAIDCKYQSDYSNKEVQTAENVITRIKTVYSNITDDCRYTYEIVLIDDVRNKESEYQVNRIDGMDVCEYGMLLYQYSDKCPVAVVLIVIDDNEKIKRILIARDRNQYNVEFYNTDSPKDVPATVQPFTNHDRQAEELSSSFSGQHLKNKYEDTSSDVYVWRKADEYCKSFLKSCGYYLLESKIFSDCIGYRCNRKDYAYTVFMYAYGKDRTTKIDGDYCSKLRHYDFSKDSAVLVLYLNVKRREVNRKTEYKVCSYSGDEAYAPEMWLVSDIKGKNILQYFPRKEMMDATFRLMYAFNNNCLDVYDCIICGNNPVFDGYENTGLFLNDAFYKVLINLHKKYGNMKYGYVRYNDVIYSGVPYLEGYGFFSFQVNDKDRIIKVVSYPFDGGNNKVIEFIKADERESDSWFASIPKLIKTEPISPVATERFALKLTFDNGETKKYVLPISTDSENDEVISYNAHVFTDKIWKSANLTDSMDADIEGYAKRGATVVFANDYSIHGAFIYQESKPYTEPILKNEIVFEDEKQKVERLWVWHANGVHEDRESGLYKVLLSGQAFNYYGVSTFASRDGKRLCSINFDYIGDFSEGLALVAKSGLGYGFVNKDMQFVVPMIYEQAGDFTNGKAKLMRDGKWLFVDKNGKEINITSSETGSKYQEIGEYYEGMCKVSTLKLDFMDLAYHSDYAEIAGTWGFVNEEGKEIISPQFIYANDFFNGIAIVCKGKWTIDKKWDNEHNRGRYWTEEELWGAIDKAGNTVIPFKFDEIKRFWDTNDVFMAHYGGWDEGHWGVIDIHGNWLADPIFEDISYDYRDGLFAFYKEDKWGDDVPLGIYDIKQKKVIFEPQFSDVSFEDDGWIKVEVFDEEQDRLIEKLIDINGNEKFHSIYSSIITYKKPYEVSIRDGDKNLHGLIDEYGKTILPCEYDVVWNGLYYKERRIIFTENGKCGIKDFDGNIIIPPKYYGIHGIGDALLTVRIGEKDNWKEGLITQDGKVVLPAEYNRIISCSDNYYLCQRDGNCEILCVSNE